MEFHAFAEKVRLDLFLAEGSGTPIPSWILFNLYLGYWMRTKPNKGKRWLAVLVLPTREYSANFAALGAVIAGAHNYSEGLRWPQFSGLGPTDIVYWPSKTSRLGYSGIVSGVVGLDGQEFIEVLIQTAPRKPEVGTKLQISKEYFQQYKFSLQKPRSGEKNRTTNEAWRQFQSLIGSVSEGWHSTDDAETLIVTKVEQFLTQAKDVCFLLYGESVDLIDLLCVERNRDYRQSKTKIEPVKGDITGKFPLVILDGITPYYIQEHINQASNLLLILDRSEFDQGVLSDISALAQAFPVHAPETLVRPLNSLCCSVELVIFELNSF